MQRVDIKGKVSERLRQKLVVDSLQKSARSESPRTRASRLSLAGRSSRVSTPGSGSMSPRPPPSRMSMPSIYRSGSMSSLRSGSMSSYVSERPPPSPITDRYSLLTELDWSPVRGNNNNSSQLSHPSSLRWGKKKQRSSSGWTELRRQKHDAGGSTSPSARSHFPRVEGVQLRPSSAPTATARFDMLHKKVNGKVNGISMPPIEHNQLPSTFYTPRF